MTPFFDIHTHIPANDAIVNWMNESYNLPIESDKKYAVGIHPWYIQANWKQQCHEVEQVCRLPQVLAVGECGLDTLIKVDMKTQVEIFSWHVQLAKQLNKPLIIHCVKAHQQVLAVLKALRFDGFAIFHGFNRNIFVANQILQSSEKNWLSVGKQINHASLQATLKQIPMQRVFFETDDSTIPIKQVYEEAAKMYQVPLYQLQQQVNMHICQIFKIAL